MQEILVSLHMHTRYSDGSGLHKDVIDEAHNAGLDCIVFTDHNIRVEGIEGYYRKGSHKLLVISGEEIHNQARQPQKNHLLAFGHTHELASYGYDPQLLINKVTAEKGLTFLAHPVDRALEMFHDPDISWVDWDVRGYTGLEIWNGFAELKFRLKSYLQGVFYAYNPDTYSIGPQSKMMEIWDDLTKSGKQVVGVCGADAHALKMSLGPLKRSVFPYGFHFRSLLNHVLIPELLSGDYQRDRQAILQAFRNGSCYIGNNIPASAQKFRFYAQTDHGDVQIGGKGRINKSATLQIRLPLPAECRLIKDGKLFKGWKSGEIFNVIVNEPGAYRVEACMNYLGKPRSWILSNPIYLVTDFPAVEKNPWSQTTLPDF